VQIKGTAWTRALILKIVKPMTSLFSYVFSASPLLSYYLESFSYKLTYVSLRAWPFTGFQDDVVEAPEEASKKVKLFFAYAADRWDAQFYAKAIDNIYVNIGKLVLKKKKV